MQITARFAPSGRTSRALLMTLFASAALAPATATASGQQVLADCADGKLAPSYPLADYRDALAEMPADMAEYTACASEIKASRDRMLAGAGKARATRAASSAVTPYAAASKATTIAPGTPASAGGAGLESTGPAESTDEDAATEGAPEVTSPTTPPRAQVSPTYEAADDDFLAVPIAGTGGGDAAGGDGDGGIPVIPAVIAFCVIALTATRGLIAWSRRPEHLTDDADAAAGTA